MMQNKTKEKLRMTFKGALSIWRVILFFVSLAVLMPLSLHKIENSTFYYTIFFICGIGMVLSIAGRYIVHLMKTKRVRFAVKYTTIMFHYTFISLCLYFITFLLAKRVSLDMAYILMPFAAIALSLTFSRARGLFIFI